MWPFISSLKGYFDKSKYVNPLRIIYITEYIYVTMSAASVMLIMAPQDSPFLACKSSLFASTELCRTAVENDFQFEH